MGIDLKRDTSLKNVSTLFDQIKTLSKLPIHTLWPI